MRPRRLEVEAFGPFATHQVIDFDQLGDEGLFLIWGPTGAGKSFLLDALCFALFGKTAGDRPIGRLHSDHARDATPQVVLQFLLGADEWRVTRRAARWRTKRDGTPTQDTSRAVLERRTAGGFEGVATKVTDVDRILGDHLGLTVDEFRRVVLLPQGRFEQVLRASSGEREQLLKTVFGTTVFEDVTHALEEGARKEAQAIDEAAHEQRRRQHAASAEMFRLAADLEPVQASLGALITPVMVGIGDKAAAPAEPVDQATLDRWAAGLVRAESDLTRAVGRMDDEATSARERAARVASTAGAWDERTQLRARQVELDREAATVERAQQEVSAASQAAPVQPALVAAARAASRLQAATAARQSAACSLTQAWTSSPLALPAPFDGAPGDPDALADVDDDWLRSAGAAIVSRTGDVTRAVESARRASELRVQADTARCDACEHDRAGSDLQAEAKRLAEKAVEAGALVTESQAASGRLDGLVADVERLTRWVAASRNLIAGDDRVESASRHQLLCREAEAAARLAFADLRQRQVEGMAAEMAATLTDGDACPVCGSTAHPQLAAPSHGAPTRAEVDRAELVAADATSRREVADETLGSARDHRAHLRAQAGDATERPDEVAELLDRTRAELSQVTTATNEADERQVRLAARERESESAALAAARHAEQAVACGARAEGLDRQAAEALLEVEGLLGEGVDPTACDRALVFLDTLGRALVDLAQSRSEVVAAAAVADAAAVTLRAALEGSGFSDAGAAQAAARSQDEVGRLAQRIDAWTTERARVGLELAHPSLSDLPDERPDPEPVTRAAEQATRAHHEVLEACVRVRDTARAIGEMAADHGRIETELRAARAAHEIRHRVAEVCAGRGGDRVSLQRWVLAAHFATVCDRANVRLAVMTAGRYSLQVHTGSTRGAATGLDLRVHDAHTGEAREVTSLSGGETFQASLALALGVADVVGQRSGGIDLGVLFIDEGFGTLDPDALQLALDELDELRAGGRMVGVISHVGSLRERIRAGIEVRRGTTGSQVLVGSTSRA